MTRIILFLIATLSLSACNLTPREQRFAVEDGDYAEIAKISLKYIELRGPVEAIVVPRDLPANVRKALKSQRRVVTADQVPQSSKIAAPAGYFVLDTFTIGAGEALFKGTLGPIERSTGCGTTFTIPWYMQKNDWYNASYKVEVCGQREWVE